MEKPKLYLWEKEHFSKDTDYEKVKGKGEGDKRLKTLAKFASGKILDIGFAGHPNKFLKGYVVGLDKLKCTKRPSNYQEVYQGDATKRFPFKDKIFDSVVSGDLIEHLENPSNFLRECKRVLKDNGKLVISTPNAAFFPLFILESLFIKRFYFNDTHINLFQPRIMYKLLRYNGFELVKMKGTGMYLPFTKKALPLPTGLSQHIVYIAKKWKFD